MPRKPCSGKPTVIAVIDTGFGVEDKGEDKWLGQENVKLCKFGHKNFVDDNNSDKFDTKSPVPVDTHGHGTHIAGIIDKYARAGNANYCLVILKYYDVNADGNQNLERTVKAIEYAHKIHADFINYSGGGVLRSDSEQKAIKEFIDGGGKFVAAAGNEGLDIDFFPFYPAQEDDRVIVVGALSKEGGDFTKKEDRLYISDYGKRVNRWELGKNVLSLNHYMTGTSQATAIATGKLVVDTKNLCK